MLIALLLLYFLVLRNHQFDWRPTYEPSDTEPYGSELFDSVVHRSIGNRYSVLDIDPDTLMSKSENRGKSILCTMYYADVNPEIVMPFVKNGGCLILAASSINESMSMALGYTSIGTYVGLTFQPNEGEYSTFIYHKDSRYRKMSYKVSRSLYSDCLERQANSDDSYYKKYGSNLKWNNKVSAKTDMKSNDTSPIVVSAVYGKGTIVLCSTPLLFTNYGILENNNAELIMRILSLGGNRSIIRTHILTPSKRMTKDYSERDGSVTSLMDYILGNRALQTAFYLALLGVVLFFVFNARRRQRVIPVKKPLKNGQLEFVKQIGNLYYRNRATDSIIVKKHKFLTHKLRQTLHVDITEKGELEENSKKISAYTGLSSDEVKRIISSIYDYFDQRTEEKKNIIDDIKKKRGEDIDERTLELWVMERMSRTDDKRMMAMIDDMNKIERLVGE